MASTPPVPGDTGVTITNDPIPVERVVSPAETPVEETPAAEEPSLPEGYDSWEAYGRDVATGKVKPAAAPGEETSQEETPQVSPEEAAFQAKLTPFTEEVQANGTLSDESVAKAAKEFGVTEDMVRTYLAGQQAAGERAQAPFLAEVGGDWGKFDAWFTANHPDQVETLNKALQGDPKVALAAVKSYADAFKADGVANPPRSETAGDTSGAAGGDVFESMAQQIAAQNDPRYRNDPAYRAKVEAKIGRSTGY